jgi:hypothetical protein
MIAAVIAVVAFVAWLLLRQTDDALRKPARDAIFWLVAFSITGVIGQAAFFLLANRPILGLHYVTLLVPLYAIPAAAVIAVIAEGLPRHITPVAPVVLGATCLTLLLVRGSSLADTNWERTAWTFPHIVAGINAVCDGSTAVRTEEGPELTSPIAGYDPVVKYLMTRRLVGCRYDAASDVLVVAQVDTAFPPTRTDGDGVFRLVRTTGPGIALYQRTATEWRRGVDEMPAPVPSLSARLQRHASKRGTVWGRRGSRHATPRLPS